MTLDNIKIELIEPAGSPDHWKEFFDTKDEGVHHLAFEKLRALASILLMQLKLLTTL